MIEEVYTGCKALFDHAISSQSLKIGLISLFIIVPLVRIILSVIKSQKNLYSLHGDAKHMPIKLKRIVKKHGISEENVVVIGDSQHTVFTLGFFNKKIIISTQLIARLTPRQLEAVILHEQRHVLSPHSIYLLLTEVIVQTFFFIPLFSDIATFVKVKLEKQADNHAISIQKTTRFIKRSLRKSLQEPFPTSVFPQFSYQVIDQRLDNLVNKKSGFRLDARRTGISFVSVLLIGIFFNFVTNSVMAQTVGEKINCKVFECAYQCVSRELLPNNPQMSPAYFSPATF